MSQLGTFACIVLTHKMNDADWRRTDVRMAGKGLRTNAVGNFIAAWLGGYPCTTSSTNVAVNHISHSTSRRSEEHTSELQSLMRNSYSVFCLKQKTTTNKLHT